MLALLALPAVTAVGSGLALTLATMPAARRRSFFRGLSRWVAAHKAVLSDPQVVDWCGSP